MRATDAGCREMRRPAAPALAAVASVAVPAAAVGVVGEAASAAAVASTAAVGSASALSLTLASAPARAPRLAGGATASFCARQGPASADMQAATASSSKISR
jgi:hypothetical protein